MRISVISGKGGTGKTLVSVNLACTIEDCLYADCDVEEPNGSIFLKPENYKEEEVNVMLPQPIHDKCRGCRECIGFCKFNAMAYIKDKVRIFPELCHGCEGCVSLCGYEALILISRKVGNAEYGYSGATETRIGTLNVGEVTGVPVIKHILKDLPPNKTVVIDCPPGSSCEVMESIKGSDFCVLVAEPTLFGLYNLGMVLKLVRLFSIPCGVVINKAVEGVDLIEEFCLQNNISILQRIPFDREIALMNSNGKIISKENHDYKRIFNDIYTEIRRLALK